MLLAWMLLAEGEQQTGPPGWSTILLLLPMVAVFYLFVIRPARKQESQRQALVNSLKKNDKVLTNAGIIGTVVTISEKEDEVIVRVDDNCKLRMIKSSINRNLTQEEAAKKPAEPQKAGA
jgi:preprotein translocase subunit YajC